MPLTSSLYVPGQLSETDKVMVDIGTGYYVEVGCVAPPFGRRVRVRSNLTSSRCRFGRLPQRVAWTTASVRSRF